MKLENFPFSVLIATYYNDSSNHLESALDSVFRQSLKPDQVVLVLDGPIKPESWSVVNGFQNRYPLIMGVLPLLTNIGLGPALNRGLLECKYDYVARMDADDICLENRFEKQMVYLQKNSDIDVLGANVEEFNSYPGDLKRVNQAPEKNTLFKYSRWRNPINHPTVVFKKSAVLSVGSYQDVPFFEDYYLWLLLLHKGYKIDNLSEVLVNFRNNIDTIGRRHGYRYMLIELGFFKKIYREGIMTFFQCLGNLTIRLPLRLLPKKLLSLLYHYILRKS